MQNPTALSRRSFLKVSTAAVLLARPAAWSAERSRNQPPDDEILAQCQARIEKHRKADATLVLRDATQRPVSQAAVQIEQTRHDFLFGCNFFMFDRVGDPDREEAYRAQFTALFNFCTLGFYWSNYERTRGQPGYDATDRAVAFCAQHGLLCKGHPLVWDHPAGTPRWLPDDPKEIERLSHARVQEIVSRFKGRIDLWDVVNEPTHVPARHNKTKMADWAVTLSSRDYVGRHLGIARAANPKATLLVNDYRIEPGYHKILEDLRDGGKLPFDAIGLQSHMHGGAWPLGKVWNICDTYASFGAPLHFTEATIVSGPRLGPGENWGATTPEGEARQAEDTVKFYTALFAHPAAQAVTWWDFSDHGAWQRAAAGWLRKDQSPKPVYDRLRALIKGEWWTKASGQPDAKGELSLRAFYGKHRVTVRLPNGLSVEKEIHLQRGQPNRLELTLG